jgi:soluble lytic murein transglycosylase-like protein
MKKIFLLLVLPTVSVFSISAQTNDKSIDNPAIVVHNKAEKVDIEKIETDKPAAKVETPNADDKTPATNLPAAVTEQKPQPPAAEKQVPQAAEEKAPAALEAVKKPETAETVKVETVKVETVKVETVRTEVVKTEADNKTPAEAQKPASETVKMPDEPILQVKKPTLGNLSTGNAAVDGYIEEFSTLYNVDPLLIYAQMSQESSFKARATSSKGASGFMQLMPATAARFGVTNVYNPKQNIKAGVKYMRWLLDKFGGDMRLALAGYNAGEGSVMKYGNKVPPYRETQNYVAKIMTHYELITNQNSTLATNEEVLNK